MSRLVPWLGGVALAVSLLALAWWGWQRVGLAALQLGMGTC